MKKRLETLFAEYGAIAITIYFTIFAITLGSFAIALNAGLEVDGVAGDIEGNLVRVLGHGAVHPTKIGRAPTDVDNQPQISGGKHIPVGQSSGFRLIEERYFFETRALVSFGQVNQCLGVALVICGMKLHRAT